MTDRCVIRVLLSDGAVVDLAWERSEEWLRVGVADRTGEISHPHIRRGFSFGFGVTL